MMNPLSRLLLPLVLIAALAACQRDAAPVPATPVGANAPSQAATASLGDTRLQARLIRTSELTEPMAKRYGLTRSDDEWLLLISPRTATDDAAPLAGLTIEARAGTLIDAPAPVALRAVETAGFGDYIGVVKAKAPATLRIEIDARGNGGSAQMRFSRELPAR